MKYYVCRLTGPRPSFPQDMTPQEAAIMQAHVAYCGELLRAGKALVFGPVADPAGAWGLGVLQLPDDADPQDIIANDPVVKAAAGFTYQVMPMLARRNARDLLMDTPQGHEQNADQIAYWNGPGGARWAERQASQDILLAPVAEILIDRAKPAPGERVIDVGCGSGATTNAFAQKVGLSGHVFGIDVSARCWTARGRSRRRKRRSTMRWPMPRYIRSIRKVLISWPRASA